MTVPARDLSCQGLQAVIPDDGWPDNPRPTFHGEDVEGFEEELDRRGQDHVDACSLVGCMGPGLRRVG